MVTLRNRLCPCCSKATRRTYIYHNHFFYRPSGRPIPMNRSAGEAFETLWRYFPNAARIDLGGNYRSRSYELRKFFLLNKIPLGLAKGPYGTRTHRLIILRDTHATISRTRTITKSAKGGKNVNIQL